MIRFVRILAWLRWRSLINSIRSGGRRDALEAVSRVGSLLVRVLLVAMLLPAALALAAASLVGGHAMVGSADARTVVEIVARVLLGLVSLGVLMAPLIRTVQGLQPDLQRLLLMPIPRRWLHLADVAAGLADPWVAVLVAPLALLPVGLAAAGAWPAALAALAAGLGLLLALASLGSLGTSSVMLVFRDRRRAEWVTLVLVVGLTLASFVPAAFGERFDGGPTQLRRYFAWTSVLPSELYARAVVSGAAGEATPALARLAGLWVLGLGVFAGSAGVHRRLIGGVETGSARREVGAAAIAIRRLPLVGTGVSAVAMTLVLTTLRTVRGKMAVYFVAVALLAIRLVLGARVLEHASEAWRGAVGPLMLLAGIVLTLLSLQPVWMNQFAVDGAGLSLQCLAPVSSRDLVHGKWVGCALLATISIGLCLAAALIANPGGEVLVWLSVLLAAAAGFVLLAPFAALLSILLPKSADLRRIGKAGNPHALAGFLGAVATGLALLPPAGSVVGVGLVLERPATALLLVTAWFVVAALVALPFARLASAALDRRRENLLLVAGGR